MVINDYAAREAGEKLAGNFKIHSLPGERFIWKSARKTAP